jgi:hypothetical protein
MKKTLIAIAFSLSAATSALAGPMDDFNNAAVQDLWTPTLLNFFSSDLIPVADAGFPGIRCASPNDRYAFGSIYVFHGPMGPSWLFPNTVTDCPQASINDPVFVPQSQ